MNNNWLFSSIVHKFPSIVVVQLLCSVWLFAIPWTAAHQASLFFTISWSLFTHLHWTSDAIQPSHPLLPTTPAFNFSQHQGLLQWMDLYIWWASVSTSVFPTNIQGRFILELTGLIPLLSKGLSRIFSIQPQSFKALLFQFSAFFMVQLSHLYMTTGKIIALTIWTFGSKVMPLLFKHYLGLSFLLFQVFNFMALISTLPSL